MENQGGLSESPEDDPELIFVIRFKEPVSLKSIVFTKEELLGFDQVSLYLNKENVSLDIVEEIPAQRFETVHWS